MNAAQPAAELRQRRYMHNEKANVRGLAGTVSGQQQAEVNTADTCSGNAQGRRPTLCEEAEKRAAYHRQEGNKAYRAVAFFRDHPEFDEFIQLVRTGVIQI